MADDDMMLNNKELVSRALDVILPPLQKLVISEMCYYHDRDWWYKVIVPHAGRYGLPVDIPRNPDVKGDDVIKYMDIVFCNAAIKNEKLLRRGYPKNAYDLMHSVKNIRNDRSHTVKRSYTADVARDFLGKIIELDEALELNVSDDLQRILGMVREDDRRKPATTGSAESTGSAEGTAHAASSSGPSAGGNAPSDAPVEETVTMASGVPGEPKYGIGSACMMSCEGIRQLLEEKQKENKTSSRFVVRVRDYDKVRGGIAFNLVLEQEMIVDDSTGVIIDNEDYGHDLVTFDGYEKGSRRITMYPAPVLRDLIREDSVIQLYSDMKWLIDKTYSFFEDYGEFIAYPPAPDTFAPSASLASRFEDMSADQEAAVKLIMSQPLSYVWGVPGSGKTQYVLATAINECVKRNETVAVIAPTNLSLEQVLRGLMRSFSQDKGCTVDIDRDVVRIGNPTAEFLSSYPSICERKQVQGEMQDRKVKLNRFCNVLHERRYEELRGVYEEACALSDKLDDSEASSEKVLEKFAPLRQEMLGDPRFEPNASRINTRTIRRFIGSFRGLIYGRDRSEFLEGDIARLGDAEIAAEIASLRKRIDELGRSDPKADVNSCKVIAMTLSKFIVSFGPTMMKGRSQLRVNRIFVDEAGYCNLAQIMALFTMGVPIALLGDHMQLPPVCEIDRNTFKNKIAAEPEHRNDFFWGMSALYADSFFEDSVDKLIALYGDKLESDPEFRFTSYARLATTHRFGQNLADVLGQRIYGRGIVSEGSDDMTIRVVDVHIDSFPMYGARPKRQNEAECAAVAGFIKDEAPEDYVVLTPYREQVQLLKDTRGIPKDRVLTIHKSQGREWDTVIISVCDCRACDDPSVDKPPRFTSTVFEGGSNGKKVINTALSRAKRELVIVCDTEYWLGRDGELIGDLVRAAKERIVPGKD